MHLPNMNDAKIRNQSKVNYIYENRESNDLFKGKKYFIKTYGCQMNVHDSEEISALIESLGYIKTDVLEEADFIILNTCAIRENAHDKVFGFLGRCKHLKKEKKDIIIGLCGCMAQEESVVNEIREKHPYIDIVFGTHNMNDLTKMLTNYYGKQDIEVYSKEGDVIEFGNLYKRDSNISAWVNIMYGCDKFCTYCIVPYTRGKQRSRKSEDIIKEVNELKEAGYKEITLLGQNVNAYGKDLDDVSFARLLELVSDTGIPRIRFVTSHPWDFTDEMIDVIAKRDNIMPYIHLPLQSGSSRILKLMGRRYSKDDYLTLYNKIRSKVKDVSITTDIIVGFPGETEEDFEDTIDVVKKAKFDSAYTFIYSKRTGTPAARMENQVPEDVVKDRFNRLLATVNEVSHEHIRRYEGMDMKVLVEGKDDHEEGFVTGRMTNNILVHFAGDESLIGQIVTVHLDECKGFYYMGRLIED